MDYLVFELSVIIIFTAMLCFIAELAKQPLIVAYIFAGLIAGPMGLNLIHSNGFFSAMSQVGIVLLLYLIGLELKPSKFAHTIKKSYRITLLSTLGIIPFGFLIGWSTGLSISETIYLAVALLFSSTVVVLKTMRDERGVDEEVYDTCVGILLVQDIMAVSALLVINSIQDSGRLELLEALRFLISGVLFVFFAFFTQRYALRKMIRRILDRTDLVFLMGLAWCFLLAEVAEILHLSREIGGFVAGLSLTALPAHKLHIFVSKSETLRDFFMILFFFVLGANLQLEGLEAYTRLIVITLAFILLVKPLIFNLAARSVKYSKQKSKEIGLRLGQNSEFSVIVAGVALSAGQISTTFAMVIKMILFVSIICSNYIVKYVPIGIREKG